MGLVILKTVWNEHVKTSRIMWKDLFAVLTLVNQNAGISRESYQKKLVDHSSIRKNIFACLFSVCNTISLHVTNKYVKSDK